MIKISHKDIETKSFLDYSSPLVLSVENPNAYFYFVKNLTAAFNGEESEFSFWEDSSQVLPEKKGEIIISPFYFEATDKKVVNLLREKLKNKYQNGDFIVSLNEINAKLEKFLYELCSTVDFSIDFNCLGIEELLKACSVKPSVLFDSFLEKLICYINVFIELKSISFIVLVGFKSVLSETDLLSLYKHCEMHKVALFLVEGAIVKDRLSAERQIIITEDLCEIVANIEESC